MTPSESTQGRDQPAATPAIDDTPGSPDSTTPPPPPAPSHGGPDTDGTDRSQGAEQEYLSAGEAARLLCVSPRTVSRWADQGRIPHLVTLGGHRRFARSKILELTRKGRRDGG